LVKSSIAGVSGPHKHQHKTYKAAELIDVIVEYAALLLQVDNIRDNVRGRSSAVTEVQN
jgi:hypothetical protein